MASRDGDLLSQRETVSSLRAQLEAATSHDQRASERIAELRDIERTLRAQLDDRQTELRASGEELSALRTQLHGVNTSLSRTTAAVIEWERERTGLQDQLTKLNVANAELQTSLANEQTHSQEKLSVLAGARDALVDQFKSLAAEILEEKSKRFTEQNATTLGEQLKQLLQLNQSLSADAQNLSVSVFGAGPSDLPLCGQTAS